MEQTIFQHHPEIIQAVFNSLDAPTLLNCILVCKNWYQYLETPNFWLKQLKEVGQPIEIETAWKNLIAKSKDFKIEKSIFAKCLRMKLQKFIRDQQISNDPKNVSKDILKKFPPLYTAASMGSIEIVKLIYQLGEDYNCAIYLNNNGCFVMPIFSAIENGHTEVAKFILDTPQEKSNPSFDQNRRTPLQKAIINKNFELVKFLIPKTSDINYDKDRWETGQSLLHLATRDYRILKFLMSQPGIDPNLKDCKNRTPLQMLSDYYYTTRMKIPPGDVAKMIRIIAPLANMEDLYSGSGNSPLHIAAESGSTEALETLLEFFDPNEPDNKGLPIEGAIKNLHIECVKILAPLTEELKIEEKFSTSTKKMAEVFNVLQSVINERQGILKHKIGDENSEENALLKIIVEPRNDNLYELPFENDSKCFTKDQIEKMIHLYYFDQNKNS